MGAEAAPQPPLQFEVAAVRPSDLNASLQQRIGPGSLTTRGKLKYLIMLAYDVEDYQVSGGPDWVQTDAYDIQAKTTAVSSPPQIKMMLQTLLAERFHLRLKRETRIMAGYALVVDGRAGGRKLPPPATEIPPNVTGVGKWAPAKSGHAAPP